MRDFRRSLQTDPRVLVTSTHQWKRVDLEREGLSVRVTHVGTRTPEEKGKGMCSRVNLPFKRIKNNTQGRSRVDRRIQGGGGS